MLVFRLEAQHDGKTSGCPCRAFIATLSDTSNGLAISGRHEFRAIIALCHAALSAGPVSAIW